MVNVVKIRQRIERRIARRIVSDTLTAGYAITVYDGETKTLRRSRDLKTIMGALFTTDEDHLLIHNSNVSGEFEHRSFAWVRLIYGNDGWDVVNDYTTNLESLLTGATKVADAMERLYG